MRPYICYYQNKKVELEAISALQAQAHAALALKVPAKKRYMISVLLADVTHSTCEVGS